MFVAQLQARRLRDEFVTDAMYGLEVNGMGGIPLEFLSQSQDLVIDGAGAGVIIKTPDLVQEFVPRDHPPRTGDKESKKFELKSGEGNRSV
jgi:hypothetical protein